MTYQDLLDQLKDIPEEYLDQDVEVVGDCVGPDYYDVELKLNETEYAVQIILV